ncbi:MAG: tRNA (5-methylaminomethyl-2-thiouridine)(34)-methyltransferase MnmD [Bacteroidales bacterium]|nr:tRNA (5-methylaminomethyl-2-thiouridine)(34)-methyltransferase MnmD [Bacteroidales bacterium]MCF8388646.1 tRNA (5-methylaminomethyl-2-thiouridine)(34)-methyltransferase MnmD [Bacteroidales bacterium]MCF8398067.1 tRNA (5-methylaminomethyl-2-thiouridine)(34)-methyltransferase MnmD [Bacteroidales bacterium]
MKRKLIITEDGSHSYYLPEMEETYHSIHGAITESEHVFIKNGLAVISKQNINVFEIGFGSGLNALLCYAYALRNSVEIDYQGIEKYPLQTKEYNNLNYPQQLDFGNAQEVFENMHHLSWDKRQHVSSFFSLHKIQADALKFKFPEDWADLVLFDAFGPEKQSEIWKREMMEKMFRLCKRAGVLVTYSAKGQLRRDLKNCGFSIEKLPGPPGKREMSRAIKP